MRRPQLFHGLLAVTLAAGAACNRAETQEEAREAATQVKTAAARAGDRLADGWLTAKVQAKFFADDDIKARYIDVAARDGVVTLKGFVENDAVRQDALHIARTTDGVREVNDQLLIGQPPQTASAPAADNAVGTSGAYTAVATPPGTVLDDGMVTSLVQAKFYTDPSIKLRQIDVHSASGVVTLRGQVASDNERAQALLLARTTQGVQRVEDHLTVDASLGQPAPLSGSTAVAPGATAAPAPPAQDSTSAAAPPPASSSAPTQPSGSSSASVPPPASSSAPAPPSRSSSGAVGTTGARGDDTTIENAVRAKIAGDAQLKAAGIEVSARDGVVMLQGRVANQAAKQRALEAARQAAGVTQVVDRITVGARR